MISVNEAKNIIQDHVVSLKPTTLGLLDAAGCILAEDIHSPVTMPAFAQSAMDGYAFRFEDWKAGQVITVTGEVAAGRSDRVTLQPGEAARIFTGAPVPVGADTVAIQEKVITNDHSITINDEKLKAGANIRAEGSEIMKDTLALKAGTLLSPAAIGFLAGIGIREIKVYPLPRISIIVTGKELQAPGNDLAYGQVYESNSFALTTAMRLGHVTVASVYRCDDDLAVLVATLQKALHENDMVLFTGGISAGDYDFVLSATQQCGVKKLFHKVKQKPGKPLYFGMFGEKPVFGLPGNPSSVLTCYYQYVLHAMSLLTKKNMNLIQLQTVLTGSFSKSAAATHFLKGHYDGEKVTILGAQESYRMQSFAVANCLIRIDEEKNVYNEGEIVDIYLLPA